MTSPRAESPTGTSNPLSPEHPKRILIIFGTRPEAIKLSPLIAVLKRKSPAGLQPVVCVTAQHREMLDQVLAAFRIKPEYDLDLMQPNQTLPELGARLPPDRRPGRIFLVDQFRRRVDLVH